MQNLPLLRGVTREGQPLRFLVFAIGSRYSDHFQPSSNVARPMWELGVLLAGTAATLIYYISRIFAVAREMPSADRSAM